MLNICITQKQHIAIIPNLYLTHYYLKMKKFLFFAVSLLAVSAFAAGVAFKANPFALLQSGGGGDKDKKVPTEQRQETATTNANQPEQRQVKPGEVVAEWGGKPELKPISGSNQKWYVYPNGARVSEDGTMTATPIEQPMKIVQNPDGTKSLEPVTQQEFARMMREEALKPKMGFKKELFPEK
jgi:hypothetical protein